MIDDGHIFICDPPLGGAYAITTPHKLSLEQIEYIKKRWEEVMYSPQKLIVVLGPEFKLVYLSPPKSWPDAEFCAA